MRRRHPRALTAGAFAAVAAVFTLLTPLAPAAAVTPATLSAADQAVVARVEDYLNSITTMRARFLQVAPDGANVQGTLFIMRPGRLRFEYDEPSPILIVADGTWVHFYDKELDQTSRALIGDTTVDFFTRQNMRFSGDITITDFNRDGGVINITLVDTDDPEEGAVTFTFDPEPLNLRQWIVTDAEGGQTLVALLNFETNIPLDSEMFYFYD